MFSRLRRCCARGGILLCLGMGSACDAPQSDSPESAQQDARWYSRAQVTAGAELFSRHCAVCHGEQAEGLYPDWRQRLEDGSFPPPPLNGSAHAWHHPLSILLQVVDYGGADFGGNMPAFEDVLSQDEKLAAIAFFQDFWSDEIYAQWEQMGGTN